ncbi:magnesium transporter [Halarsenatibacter silvermanii]|uniref:Magnesium transporter MgtE n=1 Tax=Halarsenatibacter silvermanii TaxID=321763 RepID=A0A1G9R594_9FIRM|nr:magnesium transporter [Halarsenatibacter silvermanii]SDM18383.1 magnesium transporter [Halarsenatibacter silvermanii]
MPGKETLLDTESLKLQVEKLEALLESGNYEEAVEISQQLSNRRIRDIIIAIPRSNILPFLRGLGWDRAGEIAAWLPEELTIELLKEMEENEQKQLFAHLDSDEVTDLLDHLPYEEQEKLWKKLHPELEEDVKKLSSHGPETAGGHMETEYVAVHRDTTVPEALQKLRRARQRINNTAYVYVTDDREKLIGVISAQELSFADRSEKAEDLMDQDIHVARVDEPVEEAAKTLQYRRLNLLPVIDEDDKLLGVLTLDTAIDQLSEKLADDFVSLTGASGEESFFTSPKEAIRMRLPWMAFNVFLNLGAVAVISSFEDTIAQIAILAAFLPMITDMGGNVGIQALSVSIRSIALGEVQLGDFVRVLRKEVAIGIFNGLALGLLFALLAYFLEGIPLLGIIAGTALAANVLVAGIVGGTFPFLIKKLGKDPAMMTGPFLTTITDITGVTIYLGLSTLFLLGVIV